MYFHGSGRTMATTVQGFWISLKNLLLTPGVSGVEGVSVEIIFGGFLFVSVLMTSGD